MAVWVLSVGVAQATLTGRVEGGDCVRAGRGGALSWRESREAMELQGA